jgi:hypothetical protein
VSNHPAGSVPIVKNGPNAVWPPTVTEIGPELAPAGTCATINVALQLLGVAVVPLNTTVLLPCAEPKFVPVIVTDVPTAPAVGDKFVMMGAVTTVKLTPLLFTPLAVTTTLPVVAPLGTVAMIDVVPQLVIVAIVLLNVTVPVPWVEPKFVPVMVTEAPAAPDVGAKLVMPGVGNTVNVILLLLTPPAYT